jgi:hypothetical protein
MAGLLVTVSATLAIAGALWMTTQHSDVGVEVVEQYGVA